MAFYATCHSSGEFVDPAGRCGWPGELHPTEVYLITGRSDPRDPERKLICDALVCSSCGQCQAGLDTRALAERLGK